jgi:HEAT repeat protein
LGRSGADAAVSNPRIDEPGYRWCVAEVLARTQDPRAEATLLDILADPTCTGFWESVLNALGALPRLTSVTPLLEALRNRDPNIVCAAALALGKRGDRSVIRQLRAVDGQYPDWLWECLTDAIQRLKRDGGVEQGDEADER